MVCMYVCVRVCTYIVKDNEGEGERVTNKID